MTAPQIIAAIRSEPFTPHRAKKAWKLVTTPAVAKEVVKELTPEESDLLLPLLQSKFGEF